MNSVLKLDKALKDAINGINVETNQSIILESKDISYCYKLALKVKNADIEKIQDIIINSDSRTKGSYISAFAINIKNANIEKLQDAIINLNINNLYNIHNIIEFAIYVKDCNIDLLEQKVLDYKSSSYCYEFAKNVPRANALKHQEIITLSNDHRLMYLFARDVKKSDKQALSEVILKSLNYHYINLFYKEINFDKSKYDLMLMFK